MLKEGEFYLTGDFPLTPPQKKRGFLYWTAHDRNGDRNTQTMLYQGQFEAAESIKTFHKTAERDLGRVMPIEEQGNRHFDTKNDVKLQCRRLK